MCLLLLLWQIICLKPPKPLELDFLPTLFTLISTIYIIIHISNLTWTRFIETNHMKFLCLDSCLRYKLIVTGFSSWFSGMWPTLGLEQNKEDEMWWRQSTISNNNISFVSKASLFERHCLVLLRMQFLLKAMLQHSGNHEKSQDGKGCQGHTEETERVEILLVPERVGEKDGDWAHSTEHWAVEVEAGAVRGWHGQVGHQGAVLKVNHGEETIVQTQAEQELEARPGPRHPEGQEWQSEERAIGREGPQTLQHYLWRCDLRAWPGRKITRQTWRVTWI